MSFLEHLICDKCGHKIILEVESPEHYDDKIVVYISCVCGGNYDKESKKMII